jgi:hypothetical protein
MMTLGKDSVMAKAKKEVRILKASEDMANLVDRGADIDTNLKNLGFEDKGIKTKLAEVFCGKLAEGETSIRIAGNTAGAMLTAVDSVEMNYGADRFDDVRSAMDSGLLEGFVEKTLSLVVPSTDVDKAAEILIAAGVKASVAETVKVESEALRSKVPASKEQSDAVGALKSCVTIDRSYRVKYDKTNGEKAE